MAKINSNKSSALIVNLSVQVKDIHEAVKSSIETKLEAAKESLVVRCIVDDGANNQAPLLEKEKTQ